MNKGLLFIGVSSMREHAGQDKLYFIADELGRQGITVTVAVPDLPENRAFLCDKPYIQTRFYPSKSALADAKAKSEILNEGGWSAAWIVGVGLRSFVWRAFSRVSVPLIKDFDEFPSMVGRIGLLRRWYLRIFEERAIAQADAFTCASSFLENSIRAKRPELKDKILRLRVAISVREHVVDPSAVAMLRAAANGRPVFLYVGTVTKMYEEQIDELIELACELRNRRSPAVVRIAGAGADLEYFKRKAKARGLGGELEFCGYVRRDRDLAAHMEAATVLIFPFPGNAFNISRCPTKAFHYAAANRPVVTNRTGEVAMLFGNSALYYPENDVGALADCIQLAASTAEVYDNHIPFASLTWESRANEFKSWLSAMGWLESVNRANQPTLQNRVN